jgi:hypothetical protein
MNHSMHGLGIGTPPCATVSKFDSRTDAFPNEQLAPKAKSIRLCPTAFARDAGSAPDIPIEDGP